LVNGVKVYTISKRILKNSYILIPTIKEQQEIVAYADEKTVKVNSLISELVSEINYLKEYKQRLIADCVTGQVNVQNVNNKTNVI
jgi:restriction endonuclease S subunit